MRTIRTVSGSTSSRPPWQVTTTLRSR